VGDTTNLVPGSLLSASLVIERKSLGRVGVLPYM